MEAVMGGCCSQILNADVYSVLRFCEWQKSEVRYKESHDKEDVQSRSLLYVREGEGES